MNAWNAVGFLAAGLVITAFCMKDIVHPRIVAVASNVAFLGYGIALGLIPVWLLNSVLLPVNWSGCGRSAAVSRPTRYKTTAKLAWWSDGRAVDAGFELKRSVQPAEPPERADPVTRYKHSADGP
ncbi:MAG TPA: hypothetical protein VL742_19665 [Casimicrobiaceae bacterium]|nr:hypothetical protein [Casimicrobiaceae bacterium]